MIAILPLGLSLALQSAVPASVSPAPKVDQEVVVTARVDQERDIERFVDALTHAPSSQSQLSRFDRAKVCPAAVGLTPDGARTVVARMRRVATAAGVPVAAAACRPNILVVVTTGKGAFVRSLMRRRPSLMPDMTRAQLRDFLDDRQPVAAWQIAGAPTNGDGAEVQQFSNAGDNFYDQFASDETSRGATRIGASIKPQFAGAMVVIAASALDGLTTAQLADYAAMRAFTATDPARLPKDGYAPTILKVIDAPMGTAIPEGLTTWDFAFLKANYKLPGQLLAPAQRGAIRAGMIDAIKAKE